MSAAEGVHVSASACEFKVSVSACECKVSVSVCGCEWECM